jgi:hypothetical protein
VQTVTLMPVPDAFVETHAGEGQRRVLVEVCGTEQGRVQSVRSVGGGEATAQAAAKVWARKMGFKPRKERFCQGVRFDLTWVPAARVVEDTGPKPPGMLLYWFARGLCENCPEPALDADATGLLLFRICVTEAGQVAATNSQGPTDETTRIMAEIQKWRFRPYVVGERTRPFCYVERFR